MSQIIPYSFARSTLFWLLSRSKFSTIFALCAITLTSCSQSIPEGYRKSPQPVVEKPEAINLYVEVLLVDQQNMPKGNVEIQGETGEFSDTETTGPDGTVRLHVGRREAEPIKFSFRNAKNQATYYVNNLPSQMRHVGMLFRYVAPHQVRLESYSTDR